MNAPSTLAEVDYATGRVVLTCHLDASTTIRYTYMNQDTLLMTEAQLETALAPQSSPMTSRKFMLTVFVVVMSVVMLWFGKITPTDWVWIVLGAPAGYGTLNVVEKKVAS